ncbi:hypothetical protein HYW21_02795 [Candidatus Woesearchaeota archaeon]|nr:hypothetical protein [Candidatus Woesearchaeota archaeon]
MKPIKADSDKSKGVPWSRWLLLVILLGTVIVQTEGVQAQGSISLRETEISLDYFGSALVRDFYYLDTTTIPTISVTIPRTESVRVYDWEGELNFTYQEGVIRIIPSRQEKIYTFSVEYLTNEFTIKNRGRWQFDFTFLSSFAVEDWLFTLYFPKNTSIQSVDTNGFVVNRQEDDKLNIYLEDITNNESNRLVVYYELQGKKSIPSSSPNVDVGRSNKKVKENLFASLPWKIIGSVLLLLGLGISSWIFMKSKQKKTLSPTQKSILGTLSPTEQMIIQAIIQNREKVTQNQIRVVTGMPKSTLSRTLRKLQQKKIVEVLAIGNSNLVRLTEWFKHQ